MTGTREPVTPLEPLVLQDEGWDCSRSSVRDLGAEEVDLNKWPLDPK